MRASRLASACLLFATGSLVLSTSCGGDDDSTFRDSGAGTSGGNSSGFGNDGEAPPPPDAGPLPACTNLEQTAVPGSRPVDIVFVIDNSESMSEEIDEVEQQINENFASIIGASGTDYRVVMLSEHGAHTPGASLQRICVKSPLSGTTCEPIPTKPVDTERFMHHNVTVDSTNALCVIVDSMNAADKDGAHPGGWSKFLRPNAFKVITVLSDDRVFATCRGRTFNDQFNGVQAGTNVAGSWDSMFLALAPSFGTAARRNYVFHSIVGLSGYDPVDTSRPHPPEAPIVTTQCTPSSVAPATGYQALSKLTGGLRFPTCGLNYTSIFQSIARGVIDKATLPCDYAFPSNPSGGRIDPSTAVVRYTSGTTLQDFSQATDLTACGPGQFYVDKADNDRIKLCPDTCNLVQGDANGKVNVRFSCFPKDVQ